MASEGREFWELLENGVSLHSPQEECQGTSTPKLLVMWSSAFSGYPANLKLA